MTRNLFHSASFVKSCATFDQVPEGYLPEVAFAGRSNAGKSSTLNKLCQHTGLAHVSKTPGRTQLLNFFELSNGTHLVDLPGYGFAKAPKKERIRWGKMIEDYLQNRINLRGLIVIMDSRRPLTDHDEQMLLWCEYRNLPVHILLNKTDKLKQNEIAKMLNQTRKTLESYEMAVTCQTFSASKGTGLPQLKEKLMEWLDYEETENEEE